MLKCRHLVRKALLGVRNLSSLYVPCVQTYVARRKTPTTTQQREEILRKTGYNVFNFPAMFCMVDYLSDSGSSAMFDTQWSQMIFGDESYGRNDGYYLFLEACRDVFERKNPEYAIDEFNSPRKNAQSVFQALINREEKGGFFNGGFHQLERPNSFLVPQGRCAEFLLFNSIAEVLRREGDRRYFIPSNGFFDTTRANCTMAGLEPVDMFSESLLEQYPLEKVGKFNPFKGDISIKRLEDFILEKGVENIPMILITVTNNSGGGQPVSLKCLKQVSEVAHKYGIVLWLDACRFAENAYFIKQFEPEYKNWTTEQIVKEMFSYVDGFHISLKKDGLANMGGALFFKDDGLFRKRFSKEKDIGAVMKEKQILTFGNDSYGGMSGRDIMAVTRGLYEVTKEEYLQSRCKQTEELATGFAKQGIPVVLPPGGHAVYIDINKFFPDRHWRDFAGVGLTIELIKRYAIRTCELGAFAFEFDQRKELPDPLPPNLVRFAIPRNVFSREHIDYTIEAVKELYDQRDTIPNMRITRGESIALRHFQAQLEPVPYTRK